MTFSVALCHPFSTPSPSTAMSTSVVFQLNQTGTWFENLAVRPNGQIVATRMDLGQLWLIDPFAKTGKKLVDVPGVISTIGIAEYKPDVFAFGGGNFSLNPVSLAAGSMKVFSLDLTKELPVVTLITPLPNAGFANGLTAWSETEVLVADTNGGTVYKVAASTSARFGRTPVDSNVLYVTTSGGALQRIFGNYTEPAKIVAVKLNNV
ncbi:hypothetical protein CGCF413_v013076 [Colletotrichum fructicola]|nr:hypothetical protein CGCF413_v013076 [Colletotrichum fructicola]